MNYDPFRVDSDKTICSDAKAKRSQGTSEEASEGFRHAQHPRT